MIVHRKTTKPDSSFSLAVRNLLFFLLAAVMKTDLLDFQFFCADH